MVTATDFVTYIILLLCNFVIAAVFTPFAEPYFKWRNDQILGKVGRRESKYNRPQSNKKILAQTGRIIKFQRMLGWFLSICGASIFLTGVSWGARSFLQGSISFLTIGICIVNIAIGASIFLMGRYWRVMYPDLEFNQAGINVKSGFNEHFIRWSEISGVISVKKDLHAIIIMKRGMLLNRMYGSLIAGTGDNPVILIRINAKAFGNWKTFIMEHIPERS